MSADLMETFQKFLNDREAPEMYITGIAGTGKTTSLHDLLEYCIGEDIPTVTCAYTHKATNVLKSKLPKERGINIICTLHSFLKKRPGINMGALATKDIEVNTQASIPARVDVVFIDEFSMVGERDYVDIAELQYDDDGILETKVVYIGDPNQLPPVKDMQVVKPKKPYWVELTKVHRQAEDNMLIDTLITINGFINGEEVVPLIEHDTFIRGTDIVEEYKKFKGLKAMLAYTNLRVEELNAKAQGRHEPLAGDKLFCPTMRQFYTLEDIHDKADAIITINGDILELNSKYKTLETLHTIQGVRFFYLVNDDGHSTIHAAVFGHDKYLQLQQKLGAAAVLTNKAIESKFGQNAQDWSEANWRHELSINRKEAWRNYLSFKNNVVCIDFAHAMTVHKSQGSTYDNVYLDIEDMHKCAKSNFALYLKLMYVAISRASKMVYTN